MIPAILVLIVVVLGLLFLRRRARQRKQFWDELDRLLVELGGTGLGRDLTFTLVPGVTRFSAVLELLGTRIVFGGSGLWSRLWNGDLGYGVCCRLARPIGRFKRWTRVQRRTDVPQPLRDQLAAPWFNMVEAKANQLEIWLIPHTAARARTLVRFLETVADLAYRS